MRGIEGWMYLLPHPGMNTPAIFYLDIYSATVLDTPPLISSQLSHLMQVEREVCVCVLHNTPQSQKKPLRQTPASLGVLIVIYRSQSQLCLCLSPQQHSGHYRDHLTPIIHFTTVTTSRWGNWTEGTPSAIGKESDAFPWLNLSFCAYSHRHLKNAWHYRRFTAPGVQASSGEGVSRLCLHLFAKCADILKVSSKAICTVIERGGGGHYS